MGADCGGRFVRLAAEAAARRAFGDAIAQWENLELSRRKDGGKEAMRGIGKDMGSLSLVMWPWWTCRGRCCWIFSMAWWDAARG